MIMPSISANNRSIGIFDSGVGGLTVVKEVFRLLPNESLIYLGDTARVPYGSKSRRTVMKYAGSNANFLMTKGIKTLIIACNTASAYSLDSLKSSLPIPIIGVIEPGAIKAAQVTSNGKIGVIGTHSTIKSEAYTRALHEQNSNLKVFQKPCPLFVPLAEEGWHNNDISLKIARKYLDEIVKVGVDVLVLGCTHYPLLKETIKQVVGESITLIDSAEETANELLRLIRSGQILSNPQKRPTRDFYLTDNSEAFLTICSEFLGNEIDEIKVTDIV